MIITDGKRTVKITMQVWHEDRPGYDPDFSNDFFDAGNLPQLISPEGVNEPVYCVDDVDYCIDQANDYAADLNEYSDRDPQPDLLIDVTDL